MWSKYYITVLFLLFSMSLYAKGTSEGNLDRSIDNQADFLINNIPQNSIIAIVGISSGSENLSKYITEGLTSYIMNNNIRNIRIVERAAMPILQKEINFQYSGAVDDNFMVSLGKMVGADTVIAGTIYSICNDLRFNIRAINIETSYIISSNGINFEADNKVKTLLNGENVKDTLSRDNIPIRQNDGSISRANQELRENQRQAINNTVNFFSKDFLDRERRWLIGYSYYPDYPLGLDFSFLKNGLGFYLTFGVNIGGFDYSFSYSGETVGLGYYSIGLTYPLYFNWLWLAGGIDLYLQYTADYKSSASDYWFKNETGGIGISFGPYISIKRFYFTAKYRFIFNQIQMHNFMLGIGINLTRDEASF